MTAKDTAATAGILVATGLKAGPTPTSKRLTILTSTG
jgi:hypothetical protein